jgi:tetratricopeptide (TPR) repeat protein
MFLALAAHGLVLVLVLLWWFTQRRFLVLAVAWYYVMHITESSFIPILDPMVEHRMYIPSAALAAGFAYVLARGAASVYAYRPDWTTAFGQRFAGVLGSAMGEPVSRGLEGIRTWVHERRHPIAIGLFVAWAALTFAYGAGTFMRNKVWKDSFLIWQDTIAKRPDCARAYSSLGMELLYKGKWLEAVEPIETALTLGPYHVEGWNNIGKSYLELGSQIPSHVSSDPKKASIEPCPLLVLAESTLKRGIEVHEVAPSPSVPLCWNNLGLTYLRMSERLSPDDARVGELQAKATDALAKAVELDTYYETAWINLGTSYVRRCEKTRDPQARKALANKAANALQSSSSLRPEHTLYQIAGTNMALACRFAERHAESFFHLSQLITGKRADSLVGIYLDEANLVSNEILKLPAELLRLKRELAVIADPATKKLYLDTIAELEGELKLCDQVRPLLPKAADGAREQAEGLVAQKPLEAATHFALAARLAHTGRQEQKIVSDLYARALQVAPPGPERQRIEAEAQAVLQGP